MPGIRVAHVGLGPIGCAIAKQIAGQRAFTIVSAVDIHPSKVGKDAGEIVGLSRRLGVRVEDNTGKALEASRPDIVVHCTSSSLERVMPELETILAAKCAIVSTTEELVYPLHAHRRLARRIDAVAKRERVSVLGTGVNPGFAMDALPIMLTAVCERVDRIVINRVQDACSRRRPFQEKIGAGLTRAEFQRQVKLGGVRHVGMTESIAMIADALGWRLDRVTDRVRPKVAGAPVASEFLSVDAGHVCGIVQDAVGYRNGDPAIQLHLEAYLGAPETYESVEIEGVPRLSMTMPGGIHGDIATASVVVNSIPKVLAAQPGLHTMRDLALPSFSPRTGRLRSLA